VYHKHLVALACAISLATGAAAQDITVGVTMGTRGPGAPIGVAYSNAFQLMPKTIGGAQVKLIIYEDKSDPAEAERNARKLITEDKVDVLMGSLSLSATTQVAYVANELMTPLMALAPVVLTPEQLKWVFVLPQRPALMMGAVVEHMKTHGVKTFGYIGFSGFWGDFIENAMENLGWEAAKIHVVSQARYSPTDTNVTAQVTNVLAADPDAIVIGATGGAGALPHVTLVQRGYQKQIYHNHGEVNREFINVGGKAVEGAIAPSGPLIVAEDLPDDSPIKPVALDFIRRYEQTFGKGTRNVSSGYSYDAYLLLNAAVPAAMQKANPGTPEFRRALRDALENLHDVIGTGGVYNMTQTDHSGLDDRARVLVRVENGAWRLLK
jgi:branched-chain amino acid transport system substrate-binding protein